MKDVQVEFLVDHPGGDGFKKGDKKKLQKHIAEVLVNNKVAKYVTKRTTKAK